MEGGGRLPCFLTGQPSGFFMKTTGNMLPPIGGSIKTKNRLKQIPIHPSPLPRDGPAGGVAAVIARYFPPITHN
jgi:hypothetical protein